MSILRFAPNFESFWSKHPALFYGLLGMIAFLFGITSDWLLFVPLLLILSCVSLKRFLLAFCFSLAVYWMSTYCYSLPVISPEGIQGVAKISIDQIQLKRTPFGQQYLYRGRLISFSDSNQQLVKNGSFRISLPVKKKRSAPTQT